MRSEDMRIKWGEVRIDVDRADTFVLQRAGQWVDVAVLLVRTDEAEGPVGDVDVGPCVLRVGEDVLEVVFCDVCSVVGVASLGPFAFFGR